MKLKSALGITRSTTLTSTRLLYRRNSSNFRTIRGSLRRNCTVVMPLLNVPCMGGGIGIGQRRRWSFPTQQQYQLQYHIHQPRPPTMLILSPLMLPPQQRKVRPPRQPPLRTKLCPLKLQLHQFETSPNILIIKHRLSIWVTNIRRIMKPPAGNEAHLPPVRLRQQAQNMTLSHLKS